MAAQTVAPLHLDSNNGFCIHDSSRWPPGLPAGVAGWISLCGNANPVTPATAATQSFRAPRLLSLYLTGLIDRSRLKLLLKNQATSESRSIDPVQGPGGNWNRIDFVVPASWRGQLVRIEATATGSGTTGWLGFSQPVPYPNGTGTSDTVKLLLRTLEYFALFSILFLAACAIAIRLGISNTCLLTFLGMAALASAGYIAFWLWFFSPRVGHAFSFLIHLAAGILLVLTSRRLMTGQRRVLSLVLRPWLLTLAVALVVLSAGFFYGGLDDPLRATNSRFSHLLPTDNVIPYLFAEGIRDGHVPRPLIADWLSSDRPPLQTGLVLLEYPFVISPRITGYLLISVLLQSLWAPALWCFVESFAIARHINAWLIASVLFAGFVLVNTFFVWPKLLAAAFTICGVTLVLSPRFSRLFRDRKMIACFAGALLAFGFLAHGGSAFAALGLAPILLVLHRLRPKPLLSMALIFSTLYAPWILYQKLYEPPGDRLLKMHLAGIQKPDARPMGTALVEAYRSLSLQQILQVRRSNFSLVFDRQGEWYSSWSHFLQQSAHDLVHRSTTAAPATSTIRSLQFFSFFPSLGVFLLGPYFLLGGLWKPRRTPLWRAATLIWLYVGCTLVIWSVLMFNPDAATIHQGSYVCGLLAIAASVLAIWNVSPRTAKIAIILQSVLNFVVYVVYSQGVPAPGVLGQGIVVYPDLLLLILSMAFLGLLLWKMGKEESVALID